MDQCDKGRRPLSPPHQAREHASFSAALLDAIYRSMDTSPDRQPNTKNASPEIAHVPPAEFWRDPRAALTNHKNPSTPKQYPLTPKYQISSPSLTPRRRPSHPNRVRPDPPLSSPTNSPPKEEAEFELRTMNDKKKGKKKKKRSIIGLLKSLFSLRPDKKTKSQLASQPPQLTSQPVDPGEPACSSARSCMLSRRKSEGPKRSVRFAPVSVIVDEECKPCGHKRVCEEAVERQVEELIKALKTEERGRKKGNSSSGSELSELDSLVAAAFEDLH